MTNLMGIFLLRGRHSVRSSQQIMSKVRAIPPKLRKQVWETHMKEPRSAYGPCVVCKEEIHILNFECGHVISHVNGGNLLVDNLRPICGSCNKSMGKKNFYDYIEEFFPSESESTTESSPDILCQHKKRGGGFCDKGVFPHFGYCKEHLSDAFTEKSSPNIVLYAANTSKQVLAKEKRLYGILPKDEEAKNCQFKLLKGQRQGKKCGSDVFDHGYCSKHLYSLFDH